MGCQQWSIINACIIWHKNIYHVYFYLFALIEIFHLRIFYLVSVYFTLGLQLMKMWSVPQILGWRVSFIRGYWITTGFFSSCCSLTCCFSSVFAPRIHREFSKCIWGLNERAWSLRFGILFRAFLLFRLVSVLCQGQSVQGFSPAQADKCATHQGQSVHGLSPI